ncbi:hypothetical protein PSPO01_06893 [Paraphaeosphaeria sporulosa]
MPVPTTLKTTTSRVDHEGEKRRAGSPICTLIHRCIHCPTPLTHSPMRDLGERSSTWAILPTAALADEKRQSGSPICTIIHGFIHCPTSSVKSLTRGILPTSSTSPSGIPTPSPPPTPPDNEREEHTPTHIPGNGVPRSEYDSQV